MIAYRLFLAMNQRNDVFDVSRRHSMQYLKEVGVGKSSSESTTV